MDCVTWTASVYHDLLRSGDGTAEGIVAAYFGMVCLTPNPLFLCIVMLIPASHPVAVMHIVSLLCLCLFIAVFVSTFQHC